MSNENQRTPGRRRGLHQCATSRGCFSILAIDHRNNLRRSLNPHAPDTVPAEALTAFKCAAVAALAPEASAVLLDPEFGAVPAIERDALPSATGLIVAIEQTGYTGDPTARQSRLLPGWDAQRVRRIGGNGVKLLVYYHPDAPTAPQIETLVREVAADCAEADVPLFLETLSYSPEHARRRLTSEERRRVVTEAARRLTAYPGVDVLKTEFPLDVNAVPDPEAWEEACGELTAASRAPWVLLSAGVDFETYLRQVTVAARAGASGVAVGRAVWKEAVDLPPRERETFLNTVARERMARVTALCQALGRPW
ncbi:MAG TPA: tagatose 1,6-diphosphate aldolase [Chloroflexi bacterium]|nr:tagatose 1,6-diphosphate aldolase [Chloroflexota bacterium]